MKHDNMKLDSYTTTIDGASHWSVIIRKGMQLKITDLNGGANVGMIFYNPTLLSEKFNAPDTLKCQHTFKLTRGNCLYSEMGRVFCSITEDSFGWHDAVCGNSQASHINENWEPRNYQQDSNQWHQNGHDSFLVELAKYQLTPRDLVANLNVFSQVSSDDAGNLTLSRRSVANDHITLRFEMDTLVILHTCPHPLNKDQDYPYTPIELHLSKADPVESDDFCMNSRPENQRGFKNNAIYHLGLD